MAVKTYGIFLAYPPMVNMKAEGLGRYLASFVKAVTDNPDREVVVACPSWLRTQLHQLFADAGVRDRSYKLVGPTKVPFLLRIYLNSKRVRRPRLKRYRPWFVKLKSVVTGHLRRVVSGLVSATNPLSFFLFGLYLAMLAIIGMPVLVMLLVLKSVALSRVAASGVGRRLKARYRRRVDQIRAVINRVRSRLPQRSMQSMLFSAMHAVEIKKLVSLVNRNHTGMAWYSPTAFWPDFNKIKAPRLMCVPDVVLYEFPIPFAGYGEVIARGQNEILQAVDGGADLVTYSEHIKWETLVKNVDVDPSRVWVVRHAPSTLSRHTEITEFADNEAASWSLTRAVALQAMGKATGPSFLPKLKSFDFKFIFYASQFRPSKNVITLLRAYEYLLRKRYIKHKLILTGNGAYPSVRAFIEENNLHNDVLCLHNLTEAELASLYKCADLAVNPTLSEGGMPFTITEALSVGTPAVMGDIEVTREIILDPALRESTLFDPYDWKSMADKIEWALENKDQLYAQQREFYDEVLAKRDWSNVAQEHFDILDSIEVKWSNMR